MLNLNRRLLFALGATAAGAVPLLRAAAQGQAAGSAEQRLRDNKIELPAVPPPVAGVNNVPFVRTGNLVFLSGRGPRKPDGTFATGKVGRDVTTDEAVQQARLTGLGLLAVLRGATGSLDKVSRCVSVLGMVNAVPDYTDHPKVINGCSDLFVEVFGERGAHARSAVGMGSMPFGLTMEIEAVFEVV